MRKLLIILISLGLFLHCTGTRPDDIGIKENGKLLPCPQSPNCVNSQVDVEDEVHYIKPLEYSGSLKGAKLVLEQVIADQERSKIIENSENYIYAEFTSKIMRYVDDVEFTFDDKNKLIHVRSASRLGKKDFGVNRERIEKIKEDYTKLVK